MNLLKPQNLVLRKQNDFKKFKIFPENLQKIYFGKK